MLDVVDIEKMTERALKKHLKILLKMWKMATENKLSYNIVDTIENSINEIEEILKKN